MFVLLDQSRGRVGIHLQVESLVNSANVCLVDQTNGTDGNMSINLLDRFFFPPLFISRAHSSSE